MGGGASVETLVVTDSKPWIEVHLKKLTEAIEESIYVHEKFPLIIDPSEQAARFLKYQTGTFVNFDDPIQKMTPNLNRGLVGALQYGRTLTLKFSTLEGLDESLFTNNLFPKEILNRSKFFTDEVWQSVLQPSLGDPEPNEMTISSEFVFIICTNTNFVPAELASSMCVIKIIDKNQSAADGANNDSSAVDPEMEQIASLYGASEIIRWQQTAIQLTYFIILTYSVFRNSVALVEAAFDGDLDEVKLNIQKGYHLESTDGRKHTALSEAACQGHIEVVTYLLENGADPNAVNDTGRSALWRAAFNSHVEVMQTLLEAGANPDCKDKTSMESVFDVASSEEARAVLSQWDISRTVHLMDARRRIMMANLESRIRTSAEREQLARNLLRKELVEKATVGDVAGIKETLGLIAEEVEKGGGRSRATVEVRNDGGQSLLSIAAQTDNVELATFLLTHYKEVDKDKWDLAEGEVSAEAKIYKANPNSRDLKGWTCLCIAVFHDSRKVLALLLEHGGDPNIRSSYNKNAWDLAKDEMDAAEHVIKSRAEIRQVLVDHDTATRNAAKKQIFSRGATGSGAGLYEGLEKDGTAMVMNIEMNQEMLNNSEVSAEKKSEAKKQGNKGNKAKSSGAGNTSAAVTGKKDGKKK